MSNSKTLYRHIRHPHTPQKVTIARAEKALSGFSMKIAIAITKGLGTMICAYLFTLLAVIGFPGLRATPTQYVQWVSQTFIQLVALSVLAVGQQLLSKHSELQSDEAYNTTMKTYHDLEQVMLHLDAQDEKILEILGRLEEREKRGGVDGKTQIAPLQE